MVRRLKQTIVQRDIAAIVRAFPSEPVHIWRPTRVYGTMGQQELTEETLYIGQALLIPAGGQVLLQPIGQVANLSPQLLLVGTWPIIQGDLVRVQGKVYTISFTPSIWHGYTLLSLVDRGPGTP